MADPLNPCKCQSDFSVVEFTVRCKIAFFPSENSHVFQFKQDFYLEKKRWLCFFFFNFLIKPTISDRDWVFNSLFSTYSELVRVADLLFRNYRAHFL